MTGSPTDRRFPTGEAEPAQSEVATPMTTPDPLGPAETASPLLNVPAEAPRYPMPIRRRWPQLFTTRAAAETFARWFGDMTVQPASWWYAAVPDELHHADAARIVDRLVIGLTIETGALA